MCMRSLGLEHKWSDPSNVTREELDIGCSVHLTGHRSDVPSVRLMLCRGARIDMEELGADYEKLSSAMQKLVNESCQEPPDNNLPRSGNNLPPKPKPTTTLGGFFNRKPTGRSGSSRGLLAVSSQFGSLTRSNSSSGLRPTSPRGRVRRSNSPTILKDETVEIDEGLYNFVYRFVKAIEVHTTNISPSSEKCFQGRETVLTLLKSKTFKNANEILKAGAKLLVEGLIEKSNGPQSKNFAMEALYHFTRKATPYLTKCMIELPSARQWLFLSRQRSISSPHSSRLASPLQRSPRTSPDINLRGLSPDTSANSRPSSSRGRSSDSDKSISGPPDMKLDVESSDYFDSRPLSMGSLTRPLSNTGPSMKLNLNDRPLSATRKTKIKRRPMSAHYSRRFFGLGKKKRKKPKEKTASPDSGSKSPNFGSGKFKKFTKFMSKRKSKTLPSKHKHKNAKDSDLEIIDIAAPVVHTPPEVPESPGVARSDSLRW